MASLPALLGKMLHFKQEQYISGCITVKATLDLIVLIAHAIISQHQVYVSLARGGAVSTIYYFILH